MYGVSILGDVACLHTLPTVNRAQKQCRHACKLQQPIIAISDILYSTYNGCQT